jgi:hypothetical protein
MGNSVDCNCFAGVIGESDNLTERLAPLKEGQKFMRPTMLGMGSKAVTMTLTEDNSTIQWKCEKTTFSAEEIGELDLVNEVKRLKTSGSSGMQFLGNDGKEGEKLLFEVNAENPKTRDEWLIVLNEMLSDWNANPDKKPKSSISAAGTSNKSEYFKKREEEIKEREKRAKEMKSKYAGAGMKYTAQAMANRTW